VIRNDRQLGIAEKKLKDLSETAEGVTGRELVTYKRLINEVLNEIKEYKAVKSGSTQVFNVFSIDDIGDSVKALRRVLRRR
jgi:hypothetical protein